MSCVNPNSPEFKEILKKQSNFLLAEVIYDRALKQIDALAMNESIVNEEKITEKLNVFDSTENWDFKKPQTQKIIDNDLLNLLIADKEYSAITDPVQLERFKQLEQIIGKKETFRAYFENNKQVPTSDYFFKEQDKKVENVFDTNETYDRDVESFEKPMPSIDEYVDSLNKLIDEENNSIALIAAEKYSAQLNIPFEIITREEFDKQFPNRATSKHFYSAGKVYLVAGTITPSDVFHEFSHPVIKAIALQNPKLFSELFDSLFNTPFGQSIISTLQSDPEIEFGSQAFMEEALVMALEQINVDQTIAPVSFINNLFFQIKQFLRKVFGKKIDVSKLNSKTTLSDLVKMINSGEEFILDKNFLEADLMVLFKKDYADIIDTLSTNAEKKTQDLFNKAYSLVEEQLEQFKADGDVYVSIQEGFVDESQTGLYNKMVLALRELATNSKGRKVVEKLDKNDAENFALKIKNFAQIIGEADTVFDLFDKKLDELKNINALNDNHFNQLLAIVNYVERWSEATKQWKDDQRGAIEDTSYIDPLISMFNDFSNKLDNLNRKYSDIMADSVIDVLYNHLDKTITPMRNDLKSQMDNARTNNLQSSYQKLHLQYYGLTIEEKADFNRLKNKQDKTETEIKELQLLTYKSYDSYILTKANLKARMQNRLGDSSKFNGLMESYNNNQDVVVSGFFNFIEQTFNEVNGNANAMRSKLLKGLLPLLEAAGYDKYYFGEGGMGKDLAQESLGFTYNNSGLQPFLEYRFKNNFINYEFKIAELRSVASKAKKEYNQNATPANKLNYQIALEAVDDFDFNYMNQDYVKEYYDIKRKYFNTTVGKQALDAQERIFKKINAAKETLELKPTDVNYLDALNSLQLELKQLYNKYDFATGDLKTGDALSIAELFNDYNKEIAEYHEFTEKSTAFDLAYNVFADSMINNNIAKNSPEYIIAEKQWLERNTTISVTDDYYQRRTELVERKKELLASLKKINSNIFNEAEAYEQIYGILKLTIDPYNQYDGTSLDPAMQEKIKDIHQTIESQQHYLITLGGYTKEEFDLYEQLVDADPGSLTTEEFVFVEEFFITAGTRLALAGIDKNVLDELKDINEELQSMTLSGNTEYYVDMFNYFINSSPSFLTKLTEILNDKYDIELDNGDVLTAEILNNLVSQYSKSIDELKKIEPAFEAWFDRNHYRKEYKNFDEEGKFLGIYFGYANTAAWKYSMPNNLSYYNTRNVIGLGISNQHAPNGFIVLKDIPRVPSRQYQDKKVKDEFITEEIHKQKLIQNNISLDEIDRTHVGINGELIIPVKNNKGEFLPLDLEMDPINSTIKNEYVDSSYKQMFNNERAKWNLLNYLSNIHLDNQIGLDKYQKLYLSYPRERKGSVEQYDRNYFSRKVNRLVETVWRDAADDYEYGLNATQNNFSYKTMTKPINGSYQIDISDVSTNIISIMENYAFSVAEFKTLREKSSFANIFEKVVENLGRTPSKDVFDEMLETAEILSPLKGKTTRRILQIKSIVNKNFRGQQITGFFPSQGELYNPGKATKIVAKIINVFQKSMAFKTFMFDPIKSIRNYYGGKSMIIKKAAEGKSYNAQDLIVTRRKSGAAVSEIIKTIYSKTQVSAQLQLLDLMDAVPNNLKKEIGNREGTTVIQNFAQGKFFTSERRFLSDSVPIHQLYAILNNNSFILNGVKTPLDEAIILNSDGQIETIAGVPFEFKISYDNAGKIILGEKIKQMMSEHQSLLQKSLGLTNQYNEPEMYRNLLGKALFFLMKFFPGMSVDRYSFRTKSGKLGQTRLNLATQRNELGSFISIVQLALELIDNKGRFWKFNNYSWQAKKGTLQLVLAFMFTKIISLLTSMIGFDTDDDGLNDYYYNPNEKNVTTRLKSVTSLPNLPGVSERRKIQKTNKQFKAGNYLKLMTLRLALEVQAEEDTFFPPSVIKTAMGIATLKAPLFDGGLLKLLDQMIIQSITLGAGENTDYEQAAGPLTIHDKEQNKFAAGVAGAFGVTGTFIDPAYAIQQRQRFVLPELPWFTYYKENP